MIHRLVLLSEHRTTNDTTDTAEADKGGRAECSLPLASDVVGLPCQDAWNVSIAGCDSDKDAEVADANVLDVAEEAETLIMSA